MKNKNTNSAHPLYNTWKQLKKKSTKTNHLGRVISIPDEWQSFNGFIRDIPKKPRTHTYPTPKFVLSRINKYLPYSKENICWKKINVTTDNTNKINTPKEIKEDLPIQIPTLD